MTNGNIVINVAKLNMNVLKNKIDKLKRKKRKKKTVIQKKNKNNVLENAEALYNGLNMIIEAFENWIFESKDRPEIDVNYDLKHDQKSDLLATSDYESHGLTDKQLQMFRKFFSYKNPKELRQTVAEITDEKCNKILKALNIKLFWKIKLIPIPAFNTKD